MKTLLASVLIAALGAFALSVLSFEVAVSLAFAAGFAAIVACDYGRASRSLAIAVPAAVVAARTERLGLAA